MHDEPTTDIAIIGVAGRFPSAPNIERYWQLICQGVEGIHALTANEVARAGVSETVLRQPNYVLRGGCLDSIEELDAGFFSLSPREAELIEPQQRLMLELAWESLESAGIDVRRMPDVAVFAACSKPGYLAAGTTPFDPSWLGSTAHFQTAIATDRDYLATRVSYKLGLSGPSVTVQTACSSSLVAVHMACQSLLLGECEVALAGGVALQVPHRSGYLWQEGGYSSRDGRCRPFDAAADGTVFGSGGGVVVLRRLSEALAAADSIIAVIKGTAIGNDGSQKIGFTAPSIAGQARVIRAAQAAAGVAAQQIGYVEAHGTGTPLGDPIEVAALTQAFGQSGAATGRCAIGSVKGNIGHLDTAAGVAGLIKTALALKQGVVPPSIHYERANPAIDFASGPFYVNTRLRPWSAELPYAGVSSFGIGGTNAHAVLGPAPSSQQCSGPRAGPQLLVISARERAALQALAREYEQWLNGASAGSCEASLIAAAAAMRRTHHEYRLAVVGDTAATLAQSLRRSSQQPPLSEAAGSTARSSADAVWVFSGQGGQWIGMGRELLQAGGAFSRTVEQIDARLQQLEGWSVRAVLEGASGARPLSEVQVSQVAVFTLQMGLAAAWQELGLRPAAVVGHSMGEVAAAYVAGALTLQEALEVICARARMLDQHGPRGLMALVDLPADQAEQLLREQPEGSVWIAAYNSPRNTVLAGDSHSMRTLLLRLRGSQIYCREFETAGVAGHGPGMQAAARALEEQLSALPARAVSVPFFGTVNGACEQTLGAGYWSENLCKPVRFAQAIQALKAGGHAVFLELGPRPALAAAILETESNDALKVLASCDRPNARARFLQSLGELYTRGFNPHWQHIHGTHVPNIALPTYSWQKKKYWMDSLKQPLKPNHAAATSVSAIGRRIYSPALADALFETEVSGNCALFRSHEIFGRTTVPFAAVAEMALQALNAYAPDLAFSLLSLQHETPLQLEGDQSVKLQTLVRLKGRRPAHIEIFAQDRSCDSDWRRIGIAQCEVCAERMAPVALANLRLRLRDQIPTERLWSDAASEGIALREQYRSVEQAYGNGNEGLVRLRSSPLGTEGIRHPSMLDGCLQAAQLLPLTGSAGNPTVPVSADEINVAWGVPIAWSWAHLDSQSLVGTTKVDFDFYGSVGEYLGYAKGVEFRTVQAFASTVEVASGFQVCWEKVPILSPPSATGAGNWLVVPDQRLVWKRFASLVTAAGGSCTTYPCQSSRAELSGVVDFRALDAVQIDGADELCCQAAQFLQEMIAERTQVSPPLYIVTAGAQAVEPADDIFCAQAALWGLTRSVAHEHPELNLRLVDLDSRDLPGSVRSFIERRDQVDQLLQVAVRNGVIRAARLRPLKAHSTKHSMLRGDGTYLVMGGLGGLGIRLASWLLEKGAGVLVLAGRSVSDEAARAAAALSRADRTVHVRKVDCGSSEQVSELICEIGRSMPPLRGVIHTALTLRDAVFVNLTRESFKEVFRPKVHGAWLLHEHTRHLPLDFFALFSSVAAVLGAGGQANYGAACAAMDAVAHHRRALGLSAITINWGPWDYPGSPSRGPFVKDSARYQALTVDQGFGWLDRLLAGSAAEVGPTQALVMRLRRAAWRSTGPSLLQPLLREDIADELAQRRADAGAAVSLRMGSMSRDQRIAALIGYLTERLARRLRCAVISVPIEQSLPSMGLESLTIIELRNEIGSDLGAYISPRSLIAARSIRAIAALIADSLESDRGTAISLSRETALDVDSMSDEEVAAALGRILAERTVNGISVGANL
ncbi:MAG TPA: type I polyketide synthase [Steroidobacteraceae bacterium]|nr:type I polyketide synthase [Steroidobacteraceae bacterium]